MAILLIILISIALYAAYKIVNSISAKKERKWVEDVIQNHNAKNYQKVVQLFEGKEPTDFVLTIALANSLMVLGKHNESRKIFEKNIFGSKLNRLKHWGIAEFNAGNNKEAIAILQSIDKESITDSFKYDEGYDIVEALGSCFMNLKKYTLAIEAFKTAPLAKKNVVAGLNSIFIKLAECYTAVDDKKNAIKFYTKSLTYKFDSEIEKKVTELSK